MQEILLGSSGAPENVLLGLSTKMVMRIVGTPGKCRLESVLMKKGGVYVVRVWKEISVHHCKVVKDKNIIVLDDEEFIHFWFSVE